MWRSAPLSFAILSASPSALKAWSDPSFACRIFLNIGHRPPSFILCGITGGNAGMCGRFQFLRRQQMMWQKENIGNQRRNHGTGDDAGNDERVLILVDDAVREA